VFVYPQPAGHWTSIPPWLAAVVIIIIILKPSVASALYEAIRSHKAVTVKYSNEDETIVVGVCWIAAESNPSMSQSLHWNFRCVSHCGIAQGEPVSAGT
jgi:hypothetical protein